RHWLGATLTEQRAELHRIARRMRCGQQFFGIGGAATVLGRTLWEGHLEGRQLRRGEFDLPGTVLESAVPCGACSACGHVSSLVVGVTSTLLASEEMSQ